MKLRCYALNETPPKLVAARPHRAWMDAFPDRHAYRCLPLSIANAHGWEVLMPVPVEVAWNGGPDVADLTVKALKPLPGNRPIDHFARSNFSRGIVTFHTDYIFRTEPGWDLMVTGPVNRPKDNAYALTGVIEADWLPYPFTMNWQILRPGRVLFEEDEPFCMVFPVPKQALGEWQPEILRLEDDPEFARQHQSFRDSRDAFMARMREGDERAIRQGWQRHYFLGRFPDGTTASSHVNKLRLAEPVDLRPPRAVPPPPAPEPEVRRVPARRRDPRWEDDSVLNEIETDQSDRNYRGRANVDAEGRLRDASQTYRVASQADAEGCDFLYVEDLFRADECTALERAFGALQDRVFRSADIDPYWNGRFVWLRDLLAAYPDLGRLMIERHRRTIELVRDFYRLRAPIWGDLLQIVQWKPGMSMPAHADNANPDGSPHGMAYRDFSGIAYLNDGYEGGELYLTALDIAVKPRRGSFLAFTAGFHHEHAVLRVSGDALRLTMPTFYTFTAAKADPLLHGEAVA